MIIVLDASALLAALLDEPGRERVDALISGAVMTTVNLAEVAAHFARAGADRQEVAAMLRGLPIVLVAPDAEAAMEAGFISPATRSAGLSLGDRFCLAQAKRSSAVALTANRAWGQVASALGVEVELIR